MEAKEMRTIIGAGLCALVIGLGGCSPQQQAEAGNQAERAKKDVQRAAADAGAKLTDAGITAKVKTAMTASSKLNTTGINVDTVNKVVTINGAVADQNQKQLAERIAKDTVSTDVQVVNKLQVRPPVTQDAKTPAGKR
jgi:osmotically-inducible protein OsmY